MNRRAQGYAHFVIHLMKKRRTVEFLKKCLLGDASHTYKCDMIECYIDKTSWYLAFVDSSAAT